MMIAMLAMTAAMMADDGPIKRYDNGWRLYRYPEACNAGEMLADGRLVLISYFPRRSQSFLNVNDHRFDATPTGTTLDYQLVFMRGDTVDRSWGTVAAQVTGHGADDHGVSIQTSGTKLLDELASNEAFGLMDDSEVVEAVRSGDMTTLIADLKSCAAGLH